MRLLLLLLTAPVLSAATTATAPQTCDVLVDSASKSDGSGCGVKGRPACRLIRTGIAEAEQLGPGKTVCVKAGRYTDECGGGGSAITSSVTVAAETRTPGSVTIDCGSSSSGSRGPVFRFQPQTNASVLRLSGLRVINAFSSTSGGAVAAERGGLEVDGCSFENCTTGAAGDVGSHVFYSGGGGAVFARDMQSVLVAGSNFSDCAAIVPFDPGKVLSPANAAVVDMPGRTALLRACKNGDTKRYAQALGEMVSQS